MFINFKVSNFTAKLLVKKLTDNDWIVEYVNIKDDPP